MGLFEFSDPPRHGTSESARLVAEKLAFQKGLRNGRAVDNHQGPAALIQARAALNLFLKYQMIQRTPVFYANITRKLNDNGMKKAADALISEFGPRVAALPVGAASAAQKHGLLPTNCPQCGAPIHTDKAQWVDSNTVECAYCGSQIRPE